MDVRALILYFCYHPITKGVLQSTSLRHAKKCFMGTKEHLYAFRIVDGDGFTVTFRQSACDNQALDNSIVMPGISTECKEGNQRRFAGVDATILPNASG